MKSADVALDVGRAGGAVFVDRLAGMDGYGDSYPVTLTGRITAVGLMVGGLALIGVVTATLASWIVERVDDQNTKMVNATEAQVEQLRLEIAELKDLVRELRPAG